MSKANHFNTVKGAFQLRTKVLTNVTTYTAKVGSTSDMLIVDRVISIITEADGNNLTLTIPNGLYLGQKILLVFTTKGDNETVTVTITSGTSVTFDAEAEFVELMWMGADGWQKLRYKSGV